MPNVFINFNIDICLDWRVNELNELRVIILREKFRNRATAWFKSLQISRNGWILNVDTYYLFVRFVIKMPGPASLPNSNCEATFCCSYVLPNPKCIGTYEAKNACLSFYFNGQGVSFSHREFSQQCNLMCISESFLMFFEIENLKMQYKRSSIF